MPMGLSAEVNIVDFESDVFDARLPPLISWWSRACHLLSGLCFPFLPNGGNKNVS